MNKKALALTLVMGLALCIPSYAQRNAGAGRQKRAGMQQGMGMGMGPGQGMRGGQIFQELGLTDDQKQKLQPILREYRSGMADVLKSSDNPKQKAAKIKKLRKEAMSGIKAILTVEQYQKAQKAKLFDRLFSGGTPGMRLMNVMGQLKLSDTQKADIKVILQDQMSKTKPIRENTSLTPAQKQERIKPIREESMKKINKILTADQRAKLKEIMQKRPKTQKPASNF